jgi:hypothetical protein
MIGAITMHEAQDKEEGSIPHDITSNRFILGEYDLDELKDVDFGAEIAIENSGNDYIQSGRSCIVVPEKEPEMPTITISESYEFIEAVNRFSKNDIFLVASILAPKAEQEIGLTFPELLAETKMNRNELNKTLREMQYSLFIKASGRTRLRRYRLTKYGYMLYKAMCAAKSVLTNMQNQ